MCPGRTEASATPTTLVATGALAAPTIWLGSSGGADAPGPRPGSAFLFLVDGGTFAAPVGYSGHQAARTWASGPNDVWFMMGDSTTGPAGIIRWDGATFVSIALPNPNAVEIGGSAANDVWIAGANVVYYWSGPSAP